MLKKFRAMVKDEKGQALAEYGLILALIALYRPLLEMVLRHPKSTLVVAAVVVKLRGVPPELTARFCDAGAVPPIW